MENKQFPEFEEDILPQEQIQELPMNPEEPVMDAQPVEEEIQEIPIEEFIPEEEIPSQQAEAPAVEMPETEEEAVAAAMTEESAVAIPAVEEEADAPITEEPAADAQIPAEGVTALSDSAFAENADLSVTVPETSDLVEEEFREKDSDFDAMFQGKEQKAEPVKEQPKPPRMAQKGRPKRKKGEGLWGIPNILVTVVWLALIVAIGVTAGRMLWVCAADVLAFGREDKPVTITIYEADSIEDIVDKL